MDSLTEPQKLYVLERRAQFVGPARICDEWKVVFGKQSTPPSPQSLAVYDASKPAGKKLSPEHKAYFHECRKAFLADRESIGLAHPNYRLQALQNLLDDPVLSKNPEMVKDIIETAEKIEGGMYRQRTQGATPDDVGAYVREIMSDVKEAIEANVSSPEERARVQAAIKEKRSGLADGS